MRTAAADQEELFEPSVAPGRRISKNLYLFSAGSKRAVFFGTTAIYTYDEADEGSEAACIATLSQAGLAKDVEIASAFGVHRNTVGRMARRLGREGMAALAATRRGPKGAWKAKGDVMEVIAANATLPRKALQELVGKQTGTWLSLSHIYGLASAYQPAQLGLELAGSQPGPVAEAGAPSETGDGEDDEGSSNGEDVAGAAEAGPACDDGAPVVGRGEERENAAASSGGEGAGGQDDGAVGAFEPPAELPEEASGRYMGLALYYPAVAAVGLLDAARAVYKLPRSVRFGVRATFLCLLFMTLLSKTTLEAAKHLRRSELGAVVGSAVAPCVKTLRRKLAALVGQQGAAKLGELLARHWAETGFVATAYLYIDGHVKAYSGKHKLQEIWNSQRRMPLPGVGTYFVADLAGRPLLFVAEELSTNLAKAMPRIIVEIKKVLGPERRFCVVFDRGGYDGNLFSWLVSQGVDFITYQRGTPRLAKEAFRRREARFEGRRVRFMLAHDEVKVGRSGPWRRVVLRTKDGHQTPILTSLGRQVGMVRVAAFMFARWREENLFKYMGEHHGLDNLVSYDIGPADAAATVPNPARKALDRRIKEARKALGLLKAKLGDAVLAEPRAGGRSVHGLKAAQGGKVKQLRELEAKVQALVAERDALPKRVSATEAEGLEVTRREAKAVVDRVKLAAYNAEEWLLDRLVLHYPNPHDVRDLLRSFAELSGTIEKTPTGVLVSLDPPDTPMHRQALRGLVSDLNANGATFPGTDVPVTYEVRLHHSGTAA